MRLSTSLAAILVLPFDEELFSILCPACATDNMFFVVQHMNGRSAFESHRAKRKVVPLEYYTE